MNSRACARAHNRRFTLANPNSNSDYAHEERCKEEKQQKTRKNVNYSEGEYKRVDNSQAFLTIEIASSGCV
eukprot:4254691-Pleurochrysis_carterae.AAC.1